MHNIFCSDIMPVIERQLDYNMIIMLSSSFVIFLLFLAVKVFYSDYYKDLFYSFQIRENTGTSFFIESNSSQHQAGVIVQIASMISVGTGLFTILKYSSVSQNFISIKPFSFFLIILLGFAVFIYSKVLIYKILAIVFDFTKQTNVYINATLNLIRLYGIIIFPFFLIIPFVPEFARNILIICLLAAGCIAAAYQFFFFFIHSIKIKFLNHYSILYFCTLEILPLLILGKVFGGF